MAIPVCIILMVLGTAVGAGALDVDKAQGSSATEVAQESMVKVQSESMEDMHKRIKGDSRLQWPTSALEVVQQQLASSKAAEESFKTRLLQVEETGRTLQCAQSSCTSAEFMDQLEQATDVESFLFDQLGEAEARAQEMQCRVIQLENQLQQSGTSAVSFGFSFFPAAPAKPQEAGNALLQQGYTSEVEVLDNLNAQYDKLQRQLASTKEAEEAFQAARLQERERPQATCAAHMFLNQIIQTVYAQKFLLQSLGQAETRAHELQCHVRHLEQQLAAIKETPQLEPESAQPDLVAIKASKAEEEEEEEEPESAQQDRQQEEVDQQEPESHELEQGVHAVVDEVRMMEKLSTDGDGGNGSSLLQEVNATLLKNAANSQNKTEVIATAQGQPFAIHKTGVHLSPPVHRMPRSKRAVEDGMAHEIWKHAFAEESTQPLANS